MLSVLEGLRHVLAPPASPPQTQATRVSETALLNNNNAQVDDALAESNYKLADPIVRIVSLQQSHHRL